jgi:hypothetical protein
VTRQGRVRGGRPFTKGSLYALWTGREEQKMGVSKSGLCLLVGYCLEILMESVADFNNAVVPS